MIKPNGWDDAQAFDGSSEQLPAGGYVCKIIGARVESGRYGEQIVLAIDIAEGDRKGFFQKSFDRRKKAKPDAKWPGTFYQSTHTRDGMANGYFKGLITAIEESNTGFSWNWDENTLKDKLIGFIFQEQEWQSEDGKVRSSTKPVWARSVATIREGVEVPEKKKLSLPNGSSDSGSYSSAGFTEIDDEQLPF